MIFYRGKGSVTFKEAREERVSCRHVCGKGRVKLWRLFTRESFLNGWGMYLKKKKQGCGWLQIPETEPTASFLFGCKNHFG